ncbi:MAG: hypothetical protein Q7T82_03715 [Armatimonadota bacterium]|nr:hypothetical protein [Armatimonadota bacterium]
MRKRYVTILPVMLTLAVAGAYVLAKASCDATPPYEAVASTYVLAMQNKDTAAAYSLLAEDVKTLITPDQFQEFEVSELGYAGPRWRGSTITDAAVSGSRATATVRGPTGFPGALVLERVGEKWRVLSLAPGYSPLAPEDSDLASAATAILKAWKKPRLGISLRLRPPGRKQAKEAVPWPGRADRK